MSTAIVWFRQDLRCADNPALTAACKHHKKIIPLYIQEDNPVLLMGQAQQWWLHHSLSSLKKHLCAVGLDLYFLKADILAILKELIAQYSVEAVYWNRCYEPKHIERDYIIKSELKKSGVHVVSSNGSLLNEPWAIMNQSGSYFKVFTPYWKHCLQNISVGHEEKITHWPSKQLITSQSLESLALLPSRNWAEPFHEYWQPGESGALTRLHEFISHQLNTYKTDRNIPAVLGTSHVSPHLHFGEISPHQIWRAIHDVMLTTDCNLASAQMYLSELGWREFSYYLLYHYPKLTDTNFKTSFDNFSWNDDPHALKLWQKGQTGYPIVDAGMRELWHTGYMHNRVRMIVASFLTKHLLIDWRAGAAWFWDTLLDADLANNSASWQWVAGTGADAAPYYRIFNPVLQGERFDPEGIYVKQWVPELRHVDKKWIHEPWKAPANMPKIDYPAPIVDHIPAREEALLRYRQLKK